MDCSLRLIFLSICCVLSSIAQHIDHSETLKHIKTNRNEITQAHAAGEVIARITPSRYKEFYVQIDFTLNGNSFKITKKNLNDKVKIIASSGAIACKAFYHYIKYYCNCHISWEGSQIHLPEILPTINIEQTSPSHFIYYQNVCTSSYSFPWWTWNDWQKHIDWMALQGITLTLAPIQEYIWTKVYTAMGLSKDDIDDHIAGPGFLAWQRMGNIRGWGGPATNNFKQFSHQLQLNIIHSLRDLGISIALPAFSGHVPRSLKKHFPKVRMTPVECWNNFEEKFCCPYFVDPLEPLFKGIGQLFLSKVIEEFDGTDHIYFTDPFNEMRPSSSNPAYIKEISKTIYETIESVDEKGVWLLQAWMFVKSSFWTDDLIRTFLTAPPIGRILVLDLQSEQSPQYERTQSFYGQPFIWCMLHNFGGTLGMHGSVDILNTRINEAYQLPNSTMVGVGITPEGINQNYPIYEFALERAWNYTPVNTNDWFIKYSIARYGQYNRNAQIAWTKLLNSVYAYNGTEILHGKYILCRRPNFKYKSTIWYDPQLINEAWNHLLLANEELKYSDLYKHDLVDVTRQLIQIKIEQLYVEVINAYRNNDVKTFRSIVWQFEKYFYLLDRQLGSSPNFLLGKWLMAAKDLGKNPAESQLYEINARMQITLWGPNAEILDYAMKQWSGVIIDYCLPRWQLFFKHCTDSMELGHKLNMTRFRQQVFNNIEAPFAVDTKEYSVDITGDSILIAKEIYDKFTKDKL